MVYLCKRISLCCCPLQSDCNMTILKRIALLVAIISVSARPLVKIFLRSLASAPDDDIGEIPILSTSELSSFVKGSELFYHALIVVQDFVSCCLLYSYHICIFFAYLYPPPTHLSIRKRTSNWRHKRCRVRNSTGFSKGWGTCNNRRSKQS